MKIDLPSIEEQQRFILEEGTKEAIKQLKENMKAEIIPPQSEIDETTYSNAHLLRESEGWEPPHPDLVAAYFRHFQQYFPEYGTDQRIADLLGLSSDRRVREFKNGARKVPYEIWRKFLVITGRVPQDVIRVFGIVQRTPGEVK